MFSEPLDFVKDSTFRSVLVFGSCVARLKRLTAFRNQIGCSLQQQIET